MNENKIISMAEAHKLEQELKRERLMEERAKRDARAIDKHRLESASLANLEAKKGDSHAKRLIGQLEKDAALIRNAIPFVNPVLSAAAPLCPGGLTLMGAISGTGKSTTAAAILHELYLQKKRSFIVSNEETEAKILGRIACIEAGVDFNQYIQDKVPVNVRKMVAMEIAKIEPYVTVMDDAVAATTIESIERVLKEVDEDQSYSCIVIDFFQRITKSVKMPGIERVQALYNFKDMITDYSQHARVPVVLMTQLTPLGSDESERNFETRIKWARGLYEAAATAIEIIKLKGIAASTFYVAKGRFTKAEQQINCKYENGRFIYASKSDINDLRKDAQINALNDLVNDGEVDE